MAVEKDIEELEFEEAFSELENIVKILEEGRSSLKKSVELYERGVLLKKRCDKILESAQLRINQISLDKDGSVTVEEATLQ